MTSKKARASIKKPDKTRLSRGRSRPDAIFPVAPAASSLPDSYATTLQEIKAHLRSARVRAVLAANPIVIEAYWHTGKIILARQQEASWGARVIAREFPAGPITQQPVAQMPWGHVLQIMQRIKDPAVRDFYIRETPAHGWSRATSWKYKSKTSFTSAQARRKTIST